MARIISIISGKGGVGKTNISVNLAIYLSQKGYKVCLFDADLGLANANILLGLYPDYRLEDVIEKGISIADVIIKDCYGIDIIPGSSGIEKMANISTYQLSRLIQSFSKLKNYDFIIIDTSAGISRDVISFCLASTEIIIPVTHDPTSLTDAYALIKTLSFNNFNKKVRIVINQCSNMKNARLIYSKFSETVKKYLSFKVFPLGAIANDFHVIESARKQIPFIIHYPNTKASSCIKQIGAKLIKDEIKDQKVELDTFLQGFMSFMKGSIKFSKKDPKVNSKNVNNPKQGYLIPGNNNIDQNNGSLEKSNQKRYYPVGISDPDSFKYIFEGFQDTLNILMKGINSISDELGGIRELIEKNNNKDDAHQTTVAKLETHRKKKILQHVDQPLIALDFEEFIEKRKETR